MFRYHGEICEIMGIHQIITSHVILTFDASRGHDWIKPTLAAKLSTVIALKVQNVSWHQHWWGGW